MGGGQTKYSEELGEAICKAVASGVPEYIAAQASGVHRQTLIRWKKSNGTLCDGIKKARAECIQTRINDIMAAARGGAEVELQRITTKHKDGSVTEKVIRKKTPPTWTASAWWLERQECDHFGLNRLDLKELIKALRESREARKGDK